jgi:hypothetical protein
VLIKDHIAEEIHAIKQQPGKDIWFLGSPMLARAISDGKNWLSLEVSVPACLKTESMIC